MSHGLASPSDKALAVGCDDPFLGELEPDEPHGPAPSASSSGPSRSTLECPSNTLVKPEPDEPHGFASAL